MVPLFVTMLCLQAAAAEPPSDATRAEWQSLEAASKVEAAPARARAIADLVGKLGVAEVRAAAWRTMSRAYQQALGAGSKADAVVEKQLLSPALAKDSPGELLWGCTALVDAAPALAQRCLGVLPKTFAEPKLVAERARLSGFVAFVTGDKARAARELGVAASAIGPAEDARLHLRLAEALVASKELEDACAVAQPLYVTHPLLPGAKSLLSSCGDAEAQVTALRARMRERLLKSRREGSLPVPKLSIDSPKLDFLELEPAKLGKVTVLAFFSTWCPHCQAEMPRLVAYASEVAKQPALAARVQVIGVRTAVERESEPYDAFLERHGVTFPIWTDATMSLAFVRFAKSLGMQAALPAVAVLDDKGVARYVLEAGDYKDTAQELAWAVESLLQP